VRHEITRGTAYEALGFSPEESAVRAMRVLLAAEIDRFVKRRRMTQTAAAKFFGVTQPRISNVLNGKLQGFTIDLLVKMVRKTGRVPTVSFRRAGRVRSSAGERHAA
jgi:predicted XRE-type DNA-binding protein